MGELKIQNSEMLLNMIVSAPELEPAKKELSKNMAEVKVLVSENLKLNTKVNTLAEDLQSKHAQYNSLKE